MSANETTQQKLRRHAKEFFLSGINEVDPRSCAFNSMTHCPLPTPPGRLFLIAIGKAACAMMQGAQEYLQQNDHTAHHCLLVTDHSNFKQIGDCECLSAGHPVPDSDGLRATKRLIEVLDTAQKNDLVLAFISGGGSAILPCPPDGISLEDEIALNHLLLASGIDIEGINLIRQQFSLLKGGGLARFAAPARVEALLLSDVLSDDERAIAGGLTAAPLGSVAQAITLLKKRGLWQSLPTAMREGLQTRQTEQPFPAPGNAGNALMASNRMLTFAISKNVKKNYQTCYEEKSMIGDVGNAARQLVEQASGLLVCGKPVALVCGGETTVRLGNATGRGGRNQELALRFALNVEKRGGFHLPWAFLSGGSDGRDGPTDAAGGLVDGGSINRMLSADLSPEALLKDHDSYRALDASGDLLLTGATGTNVADAQIFLAAP
ncbi:MAG: DUF4147 domain-containing protein [Hyphomicrobiales bacterium]|nr:DUF4147 domain-containing protein [Hyphomicrobiales bacterium]